MYHLVRRLLVPAAAILASLSLPTPAAAQEPPAGGTVEGLFVVVENPITSEGVQGIKNQVERARNNPNRPARTVVFDFNPDGKDVSNADYGACYNLASYIDGLRASTTTVAFVHGEVTGHTVLPVLACKELVMSPDGAIGRVLTDGVEPVKEREAQIYQDVTGDRKAQWAAIQKMFDPNVELAAGVAGPKSPFKTGTPVYIDRRDADQRAWLAGDGSPVEFATPGRVALYPSDVARKIGLSKQTAETWAEVAEAYSLSPSSVRDNVLKGRSPDAYQYTLAGEVDGAMRETVGRIVRDVRRQGGNILFLTIECSGGDLQAARELADDLREAREGDDGVLVVGFIPDQAPDAATFVAFGCGDLVMSKRLDTRDENRPEDHDEATLGDFETVIKTENPGTVDAYRKSLKELAEARGIQGIGLLVDGMFDRDLVIYRVFNKTRRTQTRLMSGVEYEGQKADWDVLRQVKPKGQYLRLNASLAEELGVARFAVETRDPARVYDLYGLTPGKVKEVTPSWIDRFAEFLRLPVVTVLLVVIGFTGLILEVKVPGLTVPGIVAALCFILVFWSQSRFSGEMFVLALLLFILGLALLGLEVFVLPGFGAPGICGIVCMLGGLGLAAFDKVPETTEDWALLGVKVSQYMLGMVGAFVLAFLIARFLPKVPYANRMVLAAPADADDGEPALPGTGEAAGLLGAIGTTNTPLRPSGVVRFGDQFIDVMSDGGFVAAGTRVQVIAVEGTRIVVKEV